MKIELNQNRGGKQMLIKFRPNVLFQGQLGNTLHLIIDRSNIFFNIPEDLIFDYSKLISGLDSAEIPEKILINIEKSTFFEKTIQSNHMFPESVSFLNQFASSDLELSKYAIALEKTTFDVIDLIEGNCKFNKLQEIFKVNYYSSAESYKTQYENDSKQSGKFLVVITENYQSQDLYEISKFTMDKRQPWILICQDAIGTNIGPYFDNTNTHHCFNCFISRIKSNDEANFLNIKNYTYSKKNKSILDFERTWAEIELIKNIIDYKLFEKRILFFDSLGGQMKSWPYLPYPLCGICKK